MTGEARYRYGTVILARNASVNVLIEQFVAAWRLRKLVAAYMRGETVLECVEVESQLF